MKVLLCMFFMHLVDDYKLQGILAELKCKNWWIINSPYPREKYEYDYIIALLEHGFMNSFMVHIPIYIWLSQNEKALFISVFAFAILHAFIDHLKANCKKINLIQDQVLHIILIVILFHLWVYFRG